MNSELLTNIRGTVKASTNIWKAIAASVAASFVFGLVLTAAQLVQWQNPFNSIPKSGAPVTVQDGKSPPPKTP
jgi:hypothetical protein